MCCEGIVVVSIIVDDAKNNVSWIRDLALKFLTNYSRILQYLVLYNPQIEEVKEDLEAQEER